MQLKLKVVKLIQIQITPFWNGVFGNLGWHVGFIKKSMVEHLSCKGINYLKNTRFDKPILQFIISKLINVLIQHGYNAHHLWNSSEIGIQARRKSSAYVLTNTWITPSLIITSSQNPRNGQLWIM
jgi:hypothetical protein